MGNITPPIDVNALHDNESGEIVLITEKTSPVGADVVVIEDSADSNNKKRVQITNLPGGADSDAVHVNVPAEISIITEKATPISGDFILIEDSADSNNKKRIQIGNLPASGSDSSAVHVDVASEISAIANKAAPVGADYILIEDSEDTNNKKHVLISALPTGLDTAAIHDDTPSEISAIANKAAPIGADYILIEDSADSNNKKHILISALPTGADTSAVHVDVAAEISIITEKATPVDADLIIIEDSADSNNKKRVQVGNLPAVTDATSIHNNVASEISAITTKASPIGADFILIEDSADSNNKKKILISSLPTNTDSSAVHVDVASEISAVTEKTALVSADMVIIEDSEDSNNKKMVQVSNLPGGTDVAAVHVDAASEISGIAEKTSPTGSDIVMIEDAAAGNAKKKVQITNLPGGADADAVHVDVPAEISIITEKVTPINADMVIIEDSADSNNKKMVQVGNLPAVADATALHDDTASEISAITAKATVVDGDFIIIEDSADSNNKKSVLLSVVSTYVLTKFGAWDTISGDQGTPLTATAPGKTLSVVGQNEAITVTVVPGTPDYISIQAEVASTSTLGVIIPNVNHFTMSGTHNQVMSIKGSAGSDTSAIHDDTASEISAITEKGSPIAADMIIIEDSADSNNKKMVQLGNLPLPAHTIASHSDTSVTGAELTTLESRVDQSVVSGAAPALLGTNVTAIPEANVVVDTGTLETRLDQITGDGFLAGTTLTQDGGLALSWIAGNIAHVDGAAYVMTTVGSPETLTDDSINYMYADANATTTTFKFSTTMPTDAAIRSIIYCEGGSIIGQYDESLIKDVPDTTHDSLDELHSEIIVSGMEVEIDADGTNANDFTVNATSGSAVFYTHSHIRETYPTTFYSAGVGHAETLIERYFHTASAWDEEDANGVDFGFWDNGTAKTAVNGSSWYTAWIFWEHGTLRADYVYPQTEHANQAAADAESLVYPPFHEGTVIPLAKFIFRGNATTFGATAFFTDIRPSHGGGVGGLGATQNAIQTIAGDTGSMTADSAAYAATIAGTNGIATSVAGSTLTVTGVAASLTAAGVVELDTAAEINTGTDSTRAMPVDQFVASNRNIRYFKIDIIAAGVDCYVATNLKGDFVVPFDCTILQSDSTPTLFMASTSTAGVGGTMVIDINKNGTTIMTANKLSIDTAEKTSTTAATQPDLTTTALVAGDVLTVDVDSVHSTTPAVQGSVLIGVRLT